MRHGKRHPGTLLAATLMLAATAAGAAEQSVELRSSGGYQSYRLPGGTENVELDTQLAGACRFNRTWGYDLSNSELWVNGGCGGRFLVRTREGGSSSHNAGAAIAAAAAIAGIALLAQHHDRHDNDYRPPPGGYPPPGGGYQPPPSYPSWGGGPIRGDNGLCLDVEGGLRQGARLIVYQCNGGANQRFSWGRGGELRVGSMCVDVANGNRNDGASLIAWACNGQSNQRWRVGSGEIRSEFSGKCMDIENGRARPGTPVIAWGCTGGRNQRWSF